LGPYTIQAAIAACHARARSFEETDWEAIVALYDALDQLAPSPIVELNRAIAVLHADGPDAALAALDAIADDPRLARYHLFVPTSCDASAVTPRQTRRCGVPPRSRRPSASATCCCRGPARVLTDHPGTDLAAVARRRTGGRRHPSGHRPDLLSRHAAPE
jgi:hypothetical protein